MKKLTTQEISFIHTCLKSAMKTDWIDARYETVDHIASSIEETWVQQPQVPFREAYNIAIQKLTNGQELEKMIKSRKRVAMKSFFYSYGSFLIDAKRWQLLIAITLISLTLSYYLLFVSFSFFYAGIGIMALWSLFFTVDYRQLTLTAQSNTKSLKYQIYKEIIALEMYGPIVISILISNKTTLSVLDMVLTCLKVYLTISFLIYKYFIYRTAIVTEFRRYKELEVNL